jgi:pre-rRNA-processing protein TSR1
VSSLKEDLPLDYARIFQFENFARTAKRVIDEEMDEDFDALAQEGQYVTLSVAGVPSDILKRNPGVPLVVFNLLPHENKMSVIHFRITMHSSYNLPIK